MDVARSRLLLVLLRTCTWQASRHAGLGARLRVGCAFLLFFGLLPCAGQRCCVRLHHRPFHRHNHTASCGRACACNHATRVAHAAPLPKQHAALHVSLRRAPCPFPAASAVDVDGFIQGMNVDCSARSYPAAGWQRQQRTLLLAVLGHALLACCAHTPPVSAVHDRMRLQWRWQVGAMTDSLRVCELETCLHAMLNECKPQASAC
jgi:hypothetical protein